MKAIRNAKISDYLKTPVGIMASGLAVFTVLSCLLYIWFGNLLLALLISACISLYVSDALRWRKRAESSRLHKQLVGFLEHMIIMLRAGKTIRYIFLNSWPGFPRPLGLYLKNIAQRLEVDPDLEAALDQFENSSKSREVGLITAGIKINSRIGGDLIILLESLSVTLRNSLRSSSRMENLTLQSRFSANIISLFPIIALIFMYIFYSSKIIDFFSTDAGTIVLIAGGLLEIAGILLMKRITRV